MDMPGLIQLINNESMDDFIPLRDVLDEEKRRAYQIFLASEYYHFPYSYESFQTAYPNINADMVYCNKGLSPLYYWEDETDILLKIPVELEGLYSAAEIEKMVLKEIAYERKQVENQDYAHIFFTLNGKMKAEYLDYILEQDKPVKNLYQMFHAVYVSTDFGASVISKDNVRKAILAMTEEEKTELVNQMAQLADTITIYRGEGSASVGYQNAYSWSLDPNVAAFYATRLGSMGGRIIEAEIKKEDILCFGSSADQEVLVFSEHVHVKELYNQHGLDYIKTQAETYEPLVNACSDVILMNQETGVYDRMHAARMAVLAASIYEKRHIEDREDIDIAILALAAAFSDTCYAANEGIEADAKKTSYDIFCNSHLKNIAEHHMVEFLLKYQEVKDALPIEETARMVPGEEARAEELLAILQDAKELDRMRFGFRSDESMDFHRLHFKESKELIMAGVIFYQVSELANEMKQKEPETQVIT